MNKILSLIQKRNVIPRYIFLILGCFICGILYNSFVIPNHVVAGGFGGLAIVINNLTGIDTILFLNISVLITIILSFIFLGKKRAMYSIIGYGMYAIMVDLTSSFAYKFSFSFDSFLFAIIIYALIDGVGCAFIYRSGFNTAGTDIIVELLQKIIKTQFGTISTAINVIIILMGAYTFSIVNAIYAIIFLLIENKISDMIVLGNSSLKLCYISTKKQEKFEKYLTEELGVGYNLIESSTNDSLFCNKEVIMCVIPSDMYYDLKREIIKNDSNATLYSTDCYTVHGGITNGLLPI